MRECLIVIERAGNNYSAYAPEVPGCVATGSTERETEENIRGALELHLRGVRNDELPPDSAEVSVKRIRWRFPNTSCDRHHTGRRHTSAERVGSAPRRGVTGGRI